LLLVNDSVGANDASVPLVGLAMINGDSEGWMDTDGAFVGIFRPADVPLSWVSFRTEEPDEILLDMFITCVEFKLDKDFSTTVGETEADEKNTFLEDELSGDKFVELSLAMTEVFDWMTEPVPTVDVFVSFRDSFDTLGDKGEESVVCNDAWVVVRLTPVEFVGRSGVLMEDILPRVVQGRVVISTIPEVFMVLVSTGGGVVVVLFSGGCGGEVVDVFCFLIGVCIGFVLGGLVVAFIVAVVASDGSVVSGLVVTVTDVIFVATLDFQLVLIDSPDIVGLNVPTDGDKSTTSDVTIIPVVGLKTAASSGPAGVVIGYAGFGANRPGQTVCRTIWTIWLTLEDRLAMTFLDAGLVVL
jgi:hypothetical protein